MVFLRPEIQSFALLTRRVVRLNICRQVERAIPLIVEDLLEGLSNLGNVKAESGKTLAVLCCWYSRQMLFDVLSILKSDYRGQIKQTPVKAFVYLTHVEAHKRGREWVKDCGDDLEGCSFRAARTPTSLQRCGDTSLPDPQSAVRVAVETGDWICSKPSQAYRSELVSAGFQYLMSPSEDVIGGHPLQGLSRTTAPADR